MTMPVDLSDLDLQQKSFSEVEISFNASENFKNDLKSLKKVVKEIGQQITRSSFDDNCVSEAVKLAVADIKTVFKNANVKSSNKMETQLNKMATKLENTLFKVQRSIF